MSAGDYAVGFALLAILLTTTLTGSVSLVAKRLPWLAGAERWTALGVVEVCALLAVHLLPGVLGILGRGSVAVAGVLWLAACVACPAARTPSEGTPPGEARRGLTLDAPSVLAWLSAAGVALLVFGFARDQIIVPSGSVDFNSFHMPDVARWIQQGSMWPISSFLPGVAPGNYPNNGDVLLLAFSMPWHADFAVRIPIYAAFIGTGIATFAVAARLGAPRPSAIAAGALICAVPAIALAALTNAITDSVMLFGFAAGLLFLVRHRASGRTSDLVVAGLALGISFGTKWYAVSAVAVVIGVWAIASALADRKVGVTARRTLLLSCLVLATGGFWLLRNWIQSGNPFFPVKVAPFGVTVFDAPPDAVRARAGYTIAHYLTDFPAWRDFIFPQLKHALGGAGAIALIGGLGATLMAALRRRRTGRWAGVIVTGAVMAGILLLVYAVTPYTAAGPEGIPLLVGADARYGVPALLIGLVLGAWATRYFRRGPLVYSAATVLAVAYGAWWSTRGELSSVRFSGGDWFAGAVIFLIAAGLAYGAWRSRGGPNVRWRFGIAGALALIAIAVGGYQVQKRFESGATYAAEPVIAKIYASAHSGTRVGLTSVWTDSGIAPILPSFGPRLAANVRYVGPNEREEQARYDSAQAFDDALARGRYDYLIVGRGRPELPPPREGRWARAAGWTLIARSDRLDLYTPPE